MELSKIKKRVDEIYPEMVEIRRYLHRHPELSFQEFETTQFIIDELEQLDIPVDQPQETGCIGVLKGGGNSDSVIALRADIDALPIQEFGDHKKQFLSENEGVAHCCGHDLHTANLLGTAKVLAELKDEIEGTVLFIFQSGEEMLPGGGRLLCETGYLQEKGVDVIYGLHTNPYQPAGEIALREGPLMARADEFEIEITGRGGHAAMPHTAVDPIVLAAEAVSRFQSIVSRAINPAEPAVITVGKIWGGTAHNIIPEKVNLDGTVRTFSDQTAMFIKNRMEQILEGITNPAGAEYRLEYNEGYPAVINIDWAANTIKNSAASLLGEKKVTLLKEPVMAAEDFAFYLQHFPGAFFFLGSGSGQSGAIYPWHHPKYNVDENCLKTGAAVMTSLVFQGINQ